MWPVPCDECAALGLPLVIKPSRVGSTVGLSLVRRDTDVGPAVEEALSFDREVLLERFVGGRELTVGVLGERALGVGEIVAPGEVFDYYSKYTPGVAREIFPADVAADLESELRRLALVAHRALKLRDFSRVDFRLDDEQRPFCLEVNTLPGMTSTSLLPQSAKVDGIDFRQLCQRIVELAWERRA